MQITLGKSLGGVRVNRAAVLPYIITSRGEIYFLLARDRNSGEITDFGGGVKKGECALSACIREFKEETSKVFENFYYNYNNFCRDLAFIDQRDKMSVLFVALSKEQAKQIIPKFKGKPPNAEISQLMWVDEKTFIMLINSTSKINKMWERLVHFYKKFYSKNVSFILHEIYSESLLIKSTCCN